MIRVLAVLPLLILSGTVSGKTFECTEAISTIFEVFATEAAPVLVVATVNPDGETGTIEVADQTFQAKYQVEGLDRTWRFFTDEGQKYGYLFLIQPDGTSAYYDHETSEGEPTHPSQAYFCRDKALDSQRVIERESREAESGAPQSGINEEEGRLEATGSTEMAAYQFALQQKVLRNWARPSSAQSGLDCIVQVRQSATGEVISARVVSCNGDASVERSIEAAVYKASPLPLPNNRLLFDPNLRFRFIPEQ
jgi:hypothetical protein